MSAELAKKGQLEVIKLEMGRNAQTIAKVVPRHIDPSSLMRVVWTAITHDPKLAQCSPLSIIRSMVQAAMLGLIPNDGRGLSYIIPYGGIATFVPGYRGLEALAYQSSDVRSIRAREVYQGDHFDWSEGMEQTLRHTPGNTPAVGPDGKELRPLIAAYCVASIRGEKISEVMQRWQIDNIRNRSAAKNSGPWVTDFPMMARKSAIKRAARYWPVATERMTPLSQALQLDDQYEMGKRQSLDDMIEENFPAPDDDPPPVPGPTSDKAAKVIAAVGEAKSKKNGDPAPVGLAGSCNGSHAAPACADPGCIHRTQEPGANG